jgi:DNA helicase-2/ATP-dependent DNA helicase PcrA
MNTDSDLFDMSTTMENNEYTPSHLLNLNPSQMEVVTQPIPSITRVIAGPGAGKTRVLTSRIVQLLYEDQNNGILGVTFTKKASGEMSHRLEDSLRKGIDERSWAEEQDEPTSADEIVQEELIESGTGTRPGKPKEMDRVTLGTFHSICAKILRWNGNELADLPSIVQYSKSSTFDGSFAILDQNEQMNIIKDIVKSCGIELKGPTTGQGDIRPITILNAVGQLKMEDAQHKDGQMNGDDPTTPGRKMSAKVRRIAEEVYPLYRRRLVDQNALDFDDLIFMARELLQKCDDVRNRLQRRWRHVVVDEFQDTSGVQMDLIRLLSTDSLLIVGDGDQSIYSWRGANAESMTDFIHQYDGEEGVNINTVYLMENYRSTTNIIRAAQRVISATEDGTREDMKPMRGKGVSPRVLACANAKAEATFVVKEINKMVENGMLNGGSTVSIIYRTNAQSRALEEACVAHNLKYLVRGSAGTFYSRIEIKDCLCFLRWIYNGRDRSAALRAIKTPSRGIGDVSMKEFFTYCEELQLDFSGKFPDEIVPTPLDILVSLVKPDSNYLPPDGLMSKRTQNRLKQFAPFMDTIRKKSRVQTVSDLIGTIIDILQLKSHFDSISKTSEEFAERWANVVELRNAAERYTEDGPCMLKKETNNELQVDDMSPLGNFLDDVSLLADIEGDTSNDDESSEKRLVANLMTIHSSKGMEFDTVFIVGNEEGKKHAYFLRYYYPRTSLNGSDIHFLGTFPTQRAIMEGDGSVELDEERRLCYVAMTRAKSFLIMTWRREITAFFGKGFTVKEGSRSRFLDTLVSQKKKVKQNSSGGSRRQSSNSAQQRNQIKNESKSRQHMIAQSPTSKNNEGNMRMRDVDGREYTKRLLKQRVESRAEKKEKYKQWNSRRLERSSPATLRKQTKAGEKSTKLINKMKEDHTSQPPVTMDSTMFFPVGSTVAHLTHGEGKVLPPPKSNDREASMLVTVAFSNGMKINFPVGNGGLRRIH